MSDILEVMPPNRKKHFMMIFSVWWL